MPSSDGLYPVKLHRLTAVPGLCTRTPFHQKYGMPCPAPLGSSHPESRMCAEHVVVDQRKEPHLPGSSGHGIVTAKATEDTHVNNVTVALIVPAHAAQIQAVVACG